MEFTALGEALPPLVRIGTSSWAYPGWAGLVYDRAATEKLLSHEGLRAYSQHPLFRAVGVDRAHYAPLSAEVYAAYAAQVPAHFRFLAKAHDALTLARYPKHPRYGAKAGEDNPRFLDASYAAEAVVGPYAEGLGKKAGPLLFQFAPQEIALMGGPLGFADRIHRFLSALPRTTFYAVEVRNAALLTPALADALHAVRAAPGLLAHPTLPELPVQARLLRAHQAPALVLRWMLHRSLTHEAAGAAFSPFDRAHLDDRGTRAHIAELIAETTRRGRPSLVIVNNNAEGSAPWSILRLAEQTAPLLGGQEASGGL